MIFLAHNSDKVKVDSERKNLYIKSVETYPDIIEWDFTIDVYKAMQGLK